MTLAAALRSLAEAEARNQQLERERACLALRVLDLEQQLVARKTPHTAHDASADPAVLSFFQDLDATPHPPAPVENGGAPAVARRHDRDSTPRPRGRQPLDPALPREVIRLPDPPAAARVDVFTGQPLQPGFTETLEVLARKPAVYFVKRYERTLWVSPAKTAPLATPWPASALIRDDENPLIFCTHYKAGRPVRASSSDCPRMRYRSSRSTRCRK